MYYKAIFLLLIALFSSNYMYGQNKNISVNDSLNRVDNNGEKKGYWIEFVDTTGNVSVCDEAVFFRLIYYESGNRIFMGTSLNKKMIFKIDGNQAIKDSIVIMDGSYKLFNNKKQLLIEEIYNNGKIEFLKEFNKEGKLIYFVDYTKRHKAFPLSAYFEEYKDNGAFNYKGYFYIDKKNRKKIIEIKN